MSKVAEHVGVESVEAKSPAPKPEKVTPARVREIAGMVSKARTAIRHWRIVVADLERVAEQLGGHGS
jgi:hypothetical protein